MLIQLEPIDETKLQIANFVSDYLDEKAYLTNRMKGNYQSLKDDWDQFLKTLEIDRESLTPKEKKVLEIYESQVLSRVSDKQ